MPSRMVIVMQKELFEVALGIEKPVFIEEISFDKEIGELHLHMNFERGGRFCCSECGEEGLRVHDTTQKTWQHLNFWQYKTFIHFRTPRVKCKKCGERLWVPPWGRKNSGFTLLFEAFTLELAKHMNVLEIAEIMGITDKRTFRVIKHWVNKSREKKDFSAVKDMGVDETSSKKGHNYITTFIDIRSGDVMFATPRRDAKTIENFAEFIKTPEQIEEVTMDMSPAFIAGARDFLPNASITFDKFHVVKLMNEAVDKVRRMEQKENPLLLKHTRYIWLKNPEKLTEKQTKKMKSLAKENLKTARAYQIKRTLQDIYRYIKEPKAAELAFEKLISWMRRCRIEPIKALVSTFLNHKEGILRYFDSRLTSGIMEGTNSRIQEVKRRAKGYRNTDNFITMIYLVCGGLDLSVPT